MEIDLKLLQHAVVLAKHRHFGRAAAALSISQPTLSRNIAALEKLLGLRLFERSHRDVGATPARAYIHDIAVQPAAIELINANPSILLELLEREWSAVAAMLMADRVDFAVFDIAALRGMPALRVEPIGPLPGVYFCRAGHPLFKKAPSKHPAVSRWWIGTRT
jgi:DNA-binding transcriptional LysR family regulator